jgi:serine/threonine-protein kinase
MADGTASPGGAAPAEAQVVSDSCILSADQSGTDVSLRPERRPWLQEGGLVARGGMGRIMRVDDRRLRREVAAKVLASATGAGEARLRFVEEAQITGQLEHPNIPPVHDLWLDERGELCFTMKLVRGRTLTQILAERSPAERTDRELEDLLRILLKVCDAVSYAHSRGVVHRDLKPDNVMVGSHGQVYVMDWGCALILGGAGGDAVSVERDPATQPIDKPGDVVGTISYLAPEQARALASRINERTDVYQLGGVLYEILTRRPPHPAREFLKCVKQAQANDVEAPQDVVAPARLPPALCRVATRALSTAPEDRFASVADFKRDLEQVMRGGWWFTTQQYPAGALVIREGEPADSAYIISAGTCEAFHEVDGKRVALRRMGTGDTFGETAIFTSRPRTASVVAVEPLTVVVVTREALGRALAGDWWLGMFVRSLAERFRDVDGQLRCVDGLREPQR